MYSLTYWDDPEDHRKKIELEIYWNIKAFQTTARVETARILKRFQEISSDLMSLDLQR